jgi:hypothetical protein
MKRTHSATIDLTVSVDEKPKALRQSTLTGKPYVERDRIGRAVVRPPKNTPSDYSLLVIGRQKACTDEEIVYVLDELQSYITREARCIVPRTLLISGDAVGAAKAAEDWAWVQPVPVPVVTKSLKDGYVQRWPLNSKSRAAVLNRDRDLIDLADVVLFFGPDASHKELQQYASDGGKLVKIISSKN